MLIPANVCSNVKKVIGCVCHKFRSFVPVSSLSYIYKSLCLSILCYAIEVYYPSTTYGRKLIESCNRFSARLIVRNFDKSANYSDLLSTLNWPPIYRIVFARRLCLIHSTTTGIKSFCRFY